jgi:hypothetical protein
MTNTRISQQQIAILRVIHAQNNQDDYNTSSQKVHAAEQAIMTIINPPFIGNVPGWNDEPGRTVDDVTGVMWKTAGALRSPEEPS